MPARSRPRVEDPEYPGLDLARSRSPYRDRNLKIFHAYFNGLPGNPTPTFHQVAQAFHLSSGNTGMIIQFLANDLFAARQRQSSKLRWDLTDQGLDRFIKYSERILPRH